jgi:hypothetical protein
MGRARDLANILSSSGSVALDSEMGLSLITPTSIAVTSGSGSISATGAVSFTSASAVSLNGCFSLNYDNYLITLSDTGSTTTQSLNLRVRANGIDNTSTNYYGKQYGGNSDQANITTNDIVGTSLPIGIAKSGEANSCDISIRNPFSSSLRTHIYAGCSFSDGTNGRVYTYGCSLSVTTSYDGITIFPASGTITGSIRVYGYRN